MTNWHLIDNYEEVAMKATREGFGEAIDELGARNEEVMVVCADLGESMKVSDFEKRYSSRFVQVGVAEQNMMGVAAGLALSGKTPFAVSYAVFSPGRNWDQIRVSVAYTNANVKIVGGHAGISVGPDGATHQAMEDIAIMRVLPRMVVVQPADSEQARKATLAIAEYKGPVYLRLTRPKTACFTTRGTPFEIGKAQVLAEGTDVTIFACGPMVYQALVAAKASEGLVSVEVVNVHTIKPLDVETVVRSARKTGKVITVEEHQVGGGLGSAIAEVLSEKYPTRMIRMGMKDSFGESGEFGELLHKYKMDAEAIMKTIIEITKNNGRYN